VAGVARWQHIMVAELRVVVVGSQSSRLQRERKEKSSPGKKKRGSRILCPN